MNSVKGSFQIKEHMAMGRAIRIRMPRNFIHKASNANGRDIDDLIVFD